MLLNVCVRARVSLCVCLSVRLSVPRLSARLCVFGPAGSINEGVKSMFMVKQVPLGCERDDKNSWGPRRSCMFRRMVPVGLHDTRALHRDYNRGY